LATECRGNLWVIEGGNQWLQPILVQWGTVCVQEDDNVGGRYLHRPVQHDSWDVAAFGNVKNTVRISFEEFAGAITGSVVEGNEGERDILRS
jgi:hypothetical protein